MKFTSTLKKHFALGLGAAVLAASIAFLNPAQTHAATVTVKAGDTVSALASTYKSTIAQIEKENNIASNHMIYVGNHYQSMVLLTQLHKLLLKLVTLSAD